MIFWFEHVYSFKPYKAYKPYIKIKKIKIQNFPLFLLLVFYNGLHLYFKYL